MSEPRSDVATPADSWTPAARRILRASAELFARRGYFATTTRDIAAVVGIKQPAIYKHFATKDAILGALVRLGLEYPFGFAEQLHTVSAPAAARLYCWLTRSLSHFQSSPYVLASMLVTPELQQDQFAPERALFDRMEQLVADLVAEGQADGDLRPLEPMTAARLILALFDALADPETAVEPDEIADFALIGLLSNPGDLPEIRRRAVELADLADQPGARRIRSAPGTTEISAGSAPAQSPSA